MSSASHGDGGGPSSSSSSSLAVGAAAPVLRALASSKTLALPLGVVSPSLLHGGNPWGRAGVSIAAGLVDLVRIGFGGTGGGGAAGLRRPFLQGLMIPSGTHGSGSGVQIIGPTFTSGLGGGFGGGFGGPGCGQHLSRKKTGQR